MADLFNYNTIDVQINLPLRSLIVTLNRPEQNNAFNNEMLFELETLINWAIPKIEVNAILIRSEQGPFSPGIDQDDLSEMTMGKVQKFYSRAQNLIHGLLQLPQTIIVDLGEGAFDMALELALAADLRICHRATQITFNHLKRGLTPGCGGITLLTELVGTANTKNWLLSGHSLNQEELLSSGLIQTVYDSLSRTEVIEQLLTQISYQAPVQRMQTKFALNESLRAKMTPQLATEKEIWKGGLVAEDWPEFSRAKKEARPPQYTSAVQFSQLIKKIKLSTKKYEEVPGV